MLATVTDMTDAAIALAEIDLVFIGPPSSKLYGMFTMEMRASSPSLSTYVLISGTSFTILRISGYPEVK
jgi:hypothetical protein